MVSISIQPGSFHASMALLNGAFAGLVYMYSLKMTKPLKLDDALHTSIVHGIGALLSMGSICFFHREEGFLFKDIYYDYNEHEDLTSIDQVKVSDVAPILLVVGSNWLSSIVIILYVSVCIGIVYQIIIPFFPRITHI